MATERNENTKEALTQEIKALKLRCINTAHIIENTPPERAISEEELNEKRLCYVEGLKTELQNTHTPITDDENRLTAQFLNDMNVKTQQLKVLVAYTKGAISDVDEEIERLTKQLQTTDEVMTYKPTQGVQVTEAHLEQAKQRFTEMKRQLHGLIQSMFPNHVDQMQKFMAILMTESASGNQYVPVTEEAYPLVEMLLGLNVVKQNPYDPTQVKLAY